MSTIGQTVRIVDLDEKSSVEYNDLISFIDSSDTSGSPDGTDSKIKIRELFESAPVRPHNDLTTIKLLSEWVSLLVTADSTIRDKTGIASTEKAGIVEYATDEEAKSKSDATRAISAKNLAALGATETLSGLIALATANEVSEGQVSNKAITPQTLFSSILGDGVIGGNNWSFKIPIKNVNGNVKFDLLIQVAEKDFTPPTTEMNPESNFNHIHNTVDIEVIYPEQFVNRALMVIPMGVEVSPNEYIESSNFWFRPSDIRVNGATIKATRLNGTNTDNKSARVRYIVIGY